MTSSLPKPLQADFDTIVLDLLSRYSLDNKSVKLFVQSVAQQTRDVRGLPRFLKEVKKSTGGTLATDNAAESDPENKGKTDLLTRLKEIKNTFNKGGLVGVFLEYLKNKKEEQSAKLVTPEKETTSVKKETEQQPVAQTVKTEKATVENTTKIIESKTNTFERIVENLQKIQEAFNSPGLLGATENIYTSQEPFKQLSPISTTSTTSYTAPAYSNDNFATTNNENVNYTQNENVNYTQDQIESQTQDVLKTKNVVILGGINEKGATDLKNILKELFEEESLFSNATSTSVTADPEQTAGGGGFGILPWLAASRGLRPGAPKPSPSKPGAPKPSPSKPGAPKPSPSKPGAPKPGGSKLGMPKPGVGGLVRGIGTMGLGMAADWAGQYIGGKIAEDIYGEEATAKAYEEYGSDIFGLFRASYDATTAIMEAKEAETRLEEQKKQTIPLDIKAMMFGYKDLADFGKAVSSGKEERRMFWDQQQQAVIVVQPNKTQEIHKFIYGKGFQGKPEVIGTDGKKVTPDITKPLPTQNPEVITVPYTSPKSSFDPEPKPSIDVKPLPTGSLKDATSPVPSPTSTAVPLTETTPVLAEATNIPPPVPSTITENNITNNNADGKALGAIAGNTEKTTQSVLSLAEAVRKLATVFDAKTTGGNSNVFINGGNGQSQQYTPTAQIAANNIDTTREIRKAFVTAVG